MPSSEAVPLSHPGATIESMKALARTSGITLLLAVCCHGAGGLASWAVVTVAALALCALFVSSARLGYFDSGREHGPAAQVVRLETTRAGSGEWVPRERCALPATGSAVRGR